MNNKAVIPLIALVFHTAFLIGAVIADPEHILTIRGGMEVGIAFTFPAILGYLVGIGRKEEE